MFEPGVGVKVIVTPPTTSHLDISVWPAQGDGNRAPRGAAVIVAAPMETKEARRKDRNGTFSFGEPFFAGIVIVCVVRKLLLRGSGGGS